MLIGRSNIGARGRVTVPAEVIRRLGAGPGAVLEWCEEYGKIVVRRSRQYDWEDVHRALFPEGPPKHRSLAELKEGIHRYVAGRHDPA